MFGAAVRVLARAAAIQLEEAAAVHPRPPPNLLKGKERAVSLRHERVVSETDLGVGARGSSIGTIPAADTSEIASNNRNGLQDHFQTITDEIEAGPSTTKQAAQLGPFPQPHPVEPLAGPRRPLVNPTPETSSTATIDSTSKAPDSASSSSIPLRDVRTAGAVARKTSAIERDTPREPSIADSIPALALPPGTTSKAVGTDYKSSASDALPVREQSVPNLKNQPDALGEPQIVDPVPSMTEPPNALVDEQDEVSPCQRLHDHQAEIIDTSGVESIKSAFIADRPFVPLWM